MAGRLGVGDPPSYFLTSGTHSALAPFASVGTLERMHKDTKSLILISIVTAVMAAGLWAAAINFHAFMPFDPAHAGHHGDHEEKAEAETEPASAENAAADGPADTPEAEATSEPESAEATDGEGAGEAESADADTANGESDGDHGDKAAGLSEKELAELKKEHDKHVGLYQAVVYFLAIALSVFTICSVGFMAATLLSMEKQRGDSAH